MILGRVDEPNARVIVRRVSPFDWDAVVVFAITISLILDKQSCVKADSIQPVGTSTVNDFSPTTAVS
jgi:hypothetical protein